MPDYKQLFEKLCADLVGAEHQGDVARSVRDALKNAGHDTRGLIGDDGLLWAWFEDHNITGE